MQVNVLSLVHKWSALVFRFHFCCTSLFLKERLTLGGTFKTFSFSVKTYHVSMKISRCIPFPLLRDLKVPMGVQWRKIDLWVKCSLLYIIFKSLGLTYCCSALYYCFRLCILGKQNKICCPEAIFYNVSDCPELWYRLLTNNQQKRFIIHIKDSWLTKLVFSCVTEAVLGNWKLRMGERGENIPPHNRFCPTKSSHHF